MSPSFTSPLLDPLAPWSRFTHGIGGLEDADRIRRGMLIHSTAPRPPVGRTPHTVIHSQNKLCVRFYAPNAQRNTRVPVVVVPSLINRSYIVDLEPDRSLVDGLADRGHPVYLVDWGVFGPEDGGVTVAHVVLELLHRALDRACRHAGAGKRVSPWLLTGRHAGSHVRRLASPQSPRAGGVQCALSVRIKRPISSVYRP